MSGLEAAVGKLSALSYVLPGHKANSVFIVPCGLVVDQLDDTAPKLSVALVLHQSPKQIPALFVGIGL